VAKERTARSQEVLDQRRLAENLLAEVMRETGGACGTFWVLDSRQAFHPVVSLGEGASGAIDPGEILRHHEDILQGVPFLAKEGEKADGSGLFLPLVHLDTLLGLAYAEVHLTAGKGLADKFPLLKEIGERYSPLIRSAQAVERLRENPLRDPESDAYHEAYLLDFLQREMARSRRHHRRLGLLALELQGVQGFQKRLGFRMTQGLLRDLVDAVLGMLRISDVVAHAGGFRVLVGLPDTDRLGCRVVSEKIRKGLRQLDYLRQSFDRYDLSPHVGFSCFPEDGNDRDSLLTSALARVQEARRDPFLRREWKERPFWTTLESIMKSPGREEVERSEGTAHGLFPTSFLYLLQEAVANDVAQCPTRRGLLYIGTNNIYVTEALIQKNPQLAKTATRISVLGDLSGMQSLGEFNINAVSVPKDLASTFQFVIHLSDLHAYAICAILKKADQWEGFHTSNDSLVEDLIFKLRDEYGLQEQI